MTKMHLNRWAAAFTHQRILNLFVAYDAMMPISVNMIDSPMSGGCPVCSKVIIHV